jgi:hypothetical protein
MLLFKKTCTLFFMLLIKYVVAQNGMQSTYDLNDSRNPNCPCHKLQKQAEDEYARQVKEAHQDRSNDNKNDFTQTSQGGNSPDGGNYVPKSASDRFQVKRKHSLKKWNNYFFKYTRKRSVRRKWYPDYSVCYKW